MLLWRHSPAPLFTSSHLHPSPCHPYDPRDFPSFLISMVPSGRGEVGLSTVQNGENRKVRLWVLCRELRTRDFRRLLDARLLLASLPSLRSRRKVGFIGFEISLVISSLPFIIRSVGHLASCLALLKYKVPTSSREKSRGREGLFWWLDIRVCN